MGPPAWGSAEMSADFILRIPVSVPHGAAGQCAKDRAILYDNNRLVITRCRGAYLSGIERQINRLLIGLAQDR
jgi:hypothetical protein